MALYLFLFDFPIFSIADAIATSKASVFSKPNFLTKKFFLTVSNSFLSELDTFSASAL
jgi:hypothetical protein